MKNSKKKVLFKPTERDLSLLKGLFHCRLLTIEHASKLYFNGSKEAATKRLRTLDKKYGVIKTKPGKVNEPNIYIFTKSGFRILSEYGKLGRFPHLTWTDQMYRRANLSNRNLLHELTVMDVKSALESKINELQNFHVIEYGTWPKLYQFQASCNISDKQSYKKKVIKIAQPDGFLRVKEDDQGNPTIIYDCFLEIDKGNESLKILINKTDLYSDYYNSGRFASEYGYIGAPKEEFPFRLLFVLDSAERLNNCCEKLLQERPKRLTLVWFATLPELLNDPLGKVWIRPIDYYKSVVGTPYEPSKRPKRKVYIRNPDREQYVSKKVQKWGLFEDPSEFVHN